MSLEHSSSEESRPAVRLTAEAQEKVIARASRLQQEAGATVTPEQLEAAAQELGIDPCYVRQALAQVQEQEAAAAAAAEQRRKIVAGWRWLGLLGLPSLLSLLAIPTGQPAWLACLSFASFFLFALLPALIYAAVPAGKAGYAPGWRLRCPGCGRTKDAGEAGIVRIGGPRLSI